MGRLENQAQKVHRRHISSCLGLEMEEEFPVMGNKETLGSSGNILYLDCDSGYVGYMICQNLLNNIIYLFIYFLLFLGPHPRHMEVPRLAAQPELQLPAYATATAMPDLSCVCDLHHSSWQCRILNPLGEARVQTHDLMVPRRIHVRCAMGTP